MAVETAITAAITRRLAEMGIRTIRLNVRLENAADVQSYEPEADLVPGRAGA